MRKNHDRAANKRGFSIALPITLIDQLEKIAQEEHRSRNGQIEYFLAKSVQAWAIQNSHKERFFENSLVAEEPKTYGTIHEDFDDNIDIDDIEDEAPFEETSKRGIIMPSDNNGNAEKGKAG